MRAFRYPHRFHFGSHNEKHSGWTMWRFRHITQYTSQSGKKVVYPLGRELRELSPRGVDCMGSADTADGEMDIASSHHHAPPLTPLSSQGWPVTSYLWYSLTVLCPNFTYTVTYPLIFNYWMTYPFVAISGYEDCLCHGLPEWHFDAAITDMMTSDHQRILVWF